MRQTEYAVELFDNASATVELQNYNEEEGKIGDEVMLISFPALGESDCNSKLPLVSHGKIDQAVTSSKNSFLLAKCECYPGSSGGAVVAKKSGKLVGIHIGSNFYEDRTYNAPASLSPRQSDYPVKSGAVRCLGWKPPPLDVDLEALSEGGSSSSSQEGMDAFNVSIHKALDAFVDSLSDVREVAYYAAVNAFQKGHHASFLPSTTLATLISVEPFVAETQVNKAASCSCKHSTKRQEMRRRVLDKKWRKQMRKLRRLTNGLKGTA